MDGIGRPTEPWGRGLHWCVVGAALVVLSAHPVEDGTYHEYVDPVGRPGLRRTVVGPTASLLSLSLVDHGQAVRAFELGPDGEVLGEADVSDPGLQARLLVSERQAHGVSEWRALDEAALLARHAALRSGAAPAPHCPVPEDEHLEHTAPDLYAAAFGIPHRVDTAAAVPPAQTRRLLQLGDLAGSPESDVARSLVSKHGLEGLVVAGNVPRGAPNETWEQGPRPGAVELTAEGGGALAKTLEPKWIDVDVVRLAQDLPTGCQLLRGLLAAGLRAGMLVVFLNGQFPPPLRFANLAQDGAPLALHGCSLSYMLDVVRPYGFHLARLSGPYAAFVHSSRLSGNLGPSSVDEFQCYRGARVWGFERKFPIDFVREWFFTLEGAQEVWRRSWSNTTAALGAMSGGDPGRAPTFLLYF